MPRYIDADALKIDIDLSNGARITDFALSLIKAVSDAPTADVVPKSEVEDYRHCWQKIHDSYNADCLEHYNKGRQEVAREIFEEIEKCLISSDVLPNCCRLADINKIVELKKKYTDGERMTKP